MSNLFLLLVQISTLAVGFSYAARVGWAGPAFERSLTGDSRVEALWLIGLSAVTALLLSQWPNEFHWSWPAFAGLAVTLILTRAFIEAYGWTNSLATADRRVMDGALRQPLLRRMVRCSMWTTVTLAMGTQLGGSLSQAVVFTAAASMLFWSTHAFHLLHLAWRTSRYGRTPWDDTASDFDVFLSYRRLDANVVRRVAEQLALRGIRVWFDEYLVRARDRRFLKEKLRHGVEHSRALAVFANDQYAQSPWCCNSELEPFLARFGPDHVTPVGMPREPVFEEKYGSTLRDCHWIVFPRNVLLDNEIAAVVNHLSPIHTDDNRPSISAPNLASIDSRIAVSSAGCTASLDLHGFVLWQHLNRDDVLARVRIMAKTLGVGPAHLEYDPRGYSDVYRYERQGPLIAVEFSAGSAAGPQRKAVAADARLSDTGLMEYTRDFAAEYFEQHGHRDLGVHTVIAFGYRHFAVTYWNMLVGAWARKYSIILPHPQTRENFEVVATFTHFGSFTDLLGFAPTMESVIASLTLG